MTFKPSWRTREVPLAGQCGDAAVPVKSMSQSALRSLRPSSHPSCLLSSFKSPCYVRYTFTIPSQRFVLLSPPQHHSACVGPRFAFAPCSSARYPLVSLLAAFVELLPLCALGAGSASHLLPL